MKWRFWKKAGTDDPAIIEAPTSPGPIHHLLVRHLVKELDLDDGWVRTLYWVTRPVVGQGNVHTFRAYSPSQMDKQGISVLEYGSLDDHRQLILFSGIFNTESWMVNLIPEITPRMA